MFVTNAEPTPIMFISGLGGIRFVAVRRLVGIGMQMDTCHLAQADFKENRHRYAQNLSMQRLVINNM